MSRKCSLADRQAEGNHWGAEHRLYNLQGLLFVVYHAQRRSDCLGSSMNVSDALYGLVNVSHI